MERRIPGNSLRFDSKCSRSDQVDRRLAERPPLAGVMNFGAPLLIADDVPRAIGAKMLILGQDQRVGKTDVPPASVATAYFPHAAGNLLEDRRSNGSGQTKQQQSCAGHSDHRSYRAFHPAHLA